MVYITGWLVVVYIINLEGGFGRTLLNLAILEEGGCIAIGGGVV